MEQWLMMKCAVLMSLLCKLMDLFFYGSLDVQWNLDENGIAFVFRYMLFVILQKNLLPDFRIRLSFINNSFLVSKFDMLHPAWNFGDINVLRRLFG